MKIKTSELIGTALDWVVMGLIFKGYEEMNSPVKPWVKARHDAGETCGSPSTNRDIGYEILETEHLGLYFSKLDNCWFCAKNLRQQYSHKGGGPTPLIAICRCFVISKLGDDVQIPDILVPTGVTPCE